MTRCSAQSAAACALVLAGFMFLAPTWRGAAGLTGGAWQHEQHASQPATPAPSAQIKSPFGAEGANRALRLAARRLRGGPFEFAEYDRNYVMLQLPAPVQEQEAERWRRMLSLSEAQAASLAAAKEWYRTEYQRIGETEIRSLWRQSAELAECDASASATECARLAEALVLAQDKVVARIVALDALLLTKVNDMLAPAQREYWQRVELFRTRERVRYVHHHHDAAAIDLSAALDYMDVRGALAVADVQGYSTALSEYEQLLTRLLVEFQRRTDKAMPMGRQNAVALETQGDTTRAHSRYEMRWQAVRNAEKRLVEVNRTYLDVLASHLEEESASLLNQWFDEASYPLIWMDRADMSGLVETALNQPQPDANVTAQVHEISAAFSSERAAIEDAMRALCDRFAYDSIGVHPHSVKPEFDAQFAAFTVSRGQAQERLASALAALVDPVPADLSR